MKLTTKQLKQIIKEELDAMHSHPMVTMADDILSVALSASYQKIMATAKKHARTLNNERMELGAHRGSHRKMLVDSFADAIYRYQTSPMNSLEGLINAAKEIRFEYQTHDQRVYDDDDDMDF
tara:strand:- start:1437 stop:1802 length:366 start_codon:yes stop_codon:yes gene_type:complete